MADQSKIEWTDATWNIVTGCSVVSPGCTNCYAMRLAGTRLRHHPSRAGLTTATKAGPVWTGETRVNWEWIEQPLSWSAPRNIFVCAHGDLFHASVGWEDIAHIYGVMIAAHHLRGHTLQVLTKRADRARELLNRSDFWELANANASMIIMERVDALDRRSDDARATCDDYGPDNPPPGIWLGVSGENQHWLMQRAPHLVETPAVRRFLSYEPALGPIDVQPFVWPARHWGNGWANHYPLAYPKHQLDWIICGGESGPGARPMHPDWARAVRDQCADAGVPFFFKQWGEWAPAALASVEAHRDLLALAPDGRGRELLNWPGHLPPPLGEPAALMARVGKKAAGRHLDGVIHSGMPEVAA